MISPYLRQNAHFVSSQLYNCVFIWSSHSYRSNHIYFYYHFLFCLWIRLSKPLDEVIVYPIPTLLYLVKNQLQVSRGNHVFILVVTIPLVFLTVEIWLMHILHFYVAILHPWACGCPGISNTEESECYQYWCSV